MVAERVRYFNGQILTAEDLYDEQQYFIERERLLVRILHGVGVVVGLDVDRGDPDGGLVVAPGFAVDRTGRLISVEEPTHLARTKPSQGYVVLRAVDEPTRPVVVNGAVEYTRWRERVVVSFEERQPKDGVVIAIADETGSIMPMTPFRPAPNPSPVASEPTAAG